MIRGIAGRKVKARSLLCFWAVRELGISLTDLAGHLGLSVPGIGYSVERGEIIARLKEEIKEVSDEIERICLRFEEYPFLLSIPGFGPGVSAQVMGAIGDPHRFNNASEVLKMAGLDLSASRSGKTSETARPVISKKGQGPPSLHVVPGRLDRIDTESRLHKRLHRGS